ncbi:MAG: type ISP restriction/modification enzyme, partial [Phototrophicales bacterium]|nr:type ISP restriction/modification enzyme [Phototrophicales bacterium]
LVAVQNPKVPPLLRGEVMRLNKDKTELVVNDSLTLTGIPTRVYDYKLGNRSALEWVIDQYRVSEDKRSGIINDPNRANDAGYIVRLVKQVVHISLETLRLVDDIAKMGF